ncbi:hypothetical protein STAS_07882 [Striga asiatica]|uniref:Uncharacterized protein n=1 Tax=Striga asiatica TaxID=4170 RepID=A0A5A7PHR2_STRAF|nr:hypothetical protein STAS_07882 [Striga asiatica]
MGQMTNKKEEEEEEEEEEQEQDGVSVHSPCKINSSSLRNEKSEVELELRLLEALRIYPPPNFEFSDGLMYLLLITGVHRHFLLYGLTEYMRKSFNRPFTSEDVIKLLERFFNLEMVKPDDEDAEFLTHEEDFRLPQSFLPEEES